MLFYLDFTYLRYVRTTSTRYGVHKAAATGVGIVGMVRPLAANVPSAIIPDTITMCYEFVVAEKSITSPIPTIFLITNFKIFSHL